MSEAIVKIKMEKGCEDLFPKKAHSTDAGFDLKSAEDVVLKLGEVKCISAGFCMELEKGWEAQIRSRSGLAAKHGISVKNSPGTIDPDYRGVIKVILSFDGIKSFDENWENEKIRREVDGASFQPYYENTFTIRRGDRIAQMVVKEIPKVMLIPAESLEDSERGTGGFGSSGVK